MKNLTSTLGRLSVGLASVLALGSCSRAEYATLPRSASYLGSTSIAAAPRQAATPAATASAEIVAPAAAAVVPAPADASLATTATLTVPKAAVAPVATVPVATVEAPAAMSAQPKLNLVQRLALAKVTKKVNKLVAKSSQLKQHSATAARGGLDQGLKTALVVLLIGIIVAAFSGVNGIFGVVGGIIVLIGLILLVLYLLDQA